MPTFANPAALWALLGIPVVLAIHFLQRRSRRVVVTTLFLLDAQRRESEKGSRIVNLRQSVPLWLQLLMVLLITWLLAGPQWMRKDAVSRLAIVMDSSASMQAFQTQTAEAVGAFTSRFLPVGTRAELTLLESNAGAQALYRGPHARELTAALANWKPNLGTHDVTPALREARQLVGQQGAVLWVTDHPPAAPLPFDAQTLSVGQPMDNVGWAGVQVQEKDGQWSWRAIVKNYAKSAQTRTWQAEVEGSLSPATAITLAPDESRVISGPFAQPTAGQGPDAGARLTLILQPDALTADDRLPILLPRPKPLSYHLQTDRRDPSADELTELFTRLGNLTREGQAAQADLRVLTWPPSLALEDNQHACIFASPSRETNAPPLMGSIVAESNPLVEGLNWQSLLAREGMVIPHEKQDEVLLWQGSRPLITLRRTAGHAWQLACHFDLFTSNARKLPALAILLHRFAERVRQEKVTKEAANFDLRQRLHIAHHSSPEAPALTVKNPAGETVSIPVHQVSLLRAPAQAGFFEIRQGEQTLLQGAAHFADVREARLTEAAPLDETGELQNTLVESRLEHDPAWQFWLLALLAALLGSWWWGRSKLPAAEVSPGRFSGSSSS